jgi:putative PIN family toxin of toxin-antitoxin system
MRLVLDTNVLVSAALKDKSLPCIALHHATQHGILLKSHATERQALDVLARPSLAALIPATTLNWITSLLATAEHIDISQTIKACRDPTDDKFLELAVNGRADFIISGDADLLVLNPFCAIPILPPQCAFPRRSALRQQPRGRVQTYSRRPRRYCRDCCRARAASTAGPYPPLQ